MSDSFPGSVSPTDSWHDLGFVFYIAKKLHFVLHYGVPESILRALFQFHSGFVFLILFCFLFFKIKETRRYLTL